MTADTDTAATRLAALHSSMTPGPWSVNRDRDNAPLVMKNGENSIAHFYDRRREQDTVGIVALRNAAPALLALLPHVRHAPECKITPYVFDPRPCTCGADAALAALRDALPEPSDA